MGPPYGKLPILFPYHSLSLGILMGVVWEAYHKGVPLLGVPENPIEKVFTCKPTDDLQVNSILGKGVVHPSY